MHKTIDYDTYYVGSNIRAARRRADLTQDALSESIGISSRHLSDIERGLVGTSISTLIKICKRLNVSADFILFGDSGGARKQASTLVEKIQSLPKHTADYIEAEIDLLIDTHAALPVLPAGIEEDNK